MTARWFGPNFPFYKGVTVAGRGGVAERQEDIRLIKNDLTQGLMTLRGERLFRPGFGGDIGRYLFDQNDSESFNALEESIRSQIELFHPRINLSRIDIREDESNLNAIIVDVYGNTTLNSTNTDELLTTFQLPVSGTISNPNSRLGT